jgi:KUP system potassium uptake protein
MSISLKNSASDASGVVKALGLVFGDIGTSPIYTLTVIFLLLKPTEQNILGVLSLITWTLTVLVSVEYAWLAMSLGKKGEGGTIVLREILAPLLKSGRKVLTVTFLSFVGISLLIGDGVITPAISILSAVEGVLLVPAMKNTSQTALIIAAGLIAIALFAFQKKGTEKVAKAFGPLMILWFLALSVSGIVSLMTSPTLLRAINPYYAIKFFVDHGISGFFILSEVILCATGGEALYADMGHLGRRPIIRAWYFVFVALMLSYFGQGSFLIQHPGAENLLFAMIFSESRILFIPFLLLSILATIIASQAMISGMFSIVYQGINTRIMPMFKVSYTSKELRSQIYISSVNWFLLLAVLFIMFYFRESHRLAAAYGLAVSGTMAITGVMMTAIFALRRQRLHAAIAILVTIADVIFLISNTYKIPHGGYVSIILATLPFALILLYTGGQRSLYRQMRPLDKDVFLESYNQLYQELNKIRGSALFFARNSRKIPPYMVHTIFRNNIIYEKNIIVSITTTDKPYGVVGSFTEELGPGLSVFEIRVGYTEVFSVDEMLKGAGIDEKAIFYGLEEISTSNPIWKMFSVIKRLTPAFVQFYDLPPSKLHGVVTRIEM